MSQPISRVPALAGGDMQKEPSLLPTFFAGGVGKIGSHNCNRPMLKRHLDVLIACNRLFSTDGMPFEHSADNVASCFHVIEQRDAQRLGNGAVMETSVARPLAQRQAAKGQLLQALQARPLTKRLAEADALYRHLADWATRDGAAPAAGRRATANG